MTQTYKKCDISKVVCGVTESWLYYKVITKIMALILKKDLILSCADVLADEETVFLFRQGVAYRVIIKDCKL